MLITRAKPSDPAPRPVLRVSSPQSLAAIYRRCAPSANRVGAGTLVALVALSVGACTSIGSPTASSPPEASPPSGAAYPAQTRSPGADEAQSLPYPPPRTPLPTAVPTSAVDADGYRALPRGVDSRMVTLDEAPHPDFLRQLKAELAAGDAVALASRVWDTRDSLITAPMSAEGTECPGGCALDSFETAGILEQMFAASSKPQIEGIHVSPDNRCLSVFTSGWREATFLLPTPTGTLPVPTSESGMGPEATVVGVPAGDQRWDFCLTEDGKAHWEHWWWGGYGELLAHLFDVTEAQPYFAVRPAGVTQSVTTSEAGAITLDVPAGWTAEQFAGPLYLQNFYAMVGRGGLGEGMTKIDVATTDKSLDQLQQEWAGTSPEQHLVRSERLTLGAKNYAALLVESDGPLGHGINLAVDVGGRVHRLACSGQCDELLAIAESIQPASSLP